MLGDMEKQTEEEQKEKKYTRENLWFIKAGTTAFVTVVSCIAVFFFLYRYSTVKAVVKDIFSAAQPILIGLVLAYLVNPIKKKVETGIFNSLSQKMKSRTKAKKTAKILAVTISIVILLAVISLFLAAVIPAAASSVVSLISSMPEDVANFISMIKNGQLGDSQIATFITEQLTNITTYLEEWAQTKLLPEAQTYISHITSGVISVVKAVLNFIIGIIVAVYVMMIEDTLIGQSKKILFAVAKPRVANIVVEVTRKANEIFSGFISGKIIDSIIIGLIAYIGCCIMHIPDAILVAIFIGLTNVIPVFGPFIGAVPSLLIVVIQSPWHALYLLIFIIILQQVDGNIIGPKILGESTGLSSFWVMFSILIFGGLFGFAGMLLGVPTFALIYYVLRRVINYTARKKSLPEDTNEYVNAYALDENTNTLRMDEKKISKKEKKQKKEEENK